LGCFRPSLISLSGTPSAPKEVQQVYQLNWGLFCTSTRSDIVTICTCLDLDQDLLDRAGISTLANNYYNSEVRSSRRADQGLEYKLKARYRSWVCCFENEVLKVMLDSVFCLVDVQSLAVYFANAPSQLF
jgi:hypothetical protein